MTDFITSNDSKIARKSALGNNGEMFGRSDDILSGAFLQLPRRVQKYLLRAAARELAPANRVAKCGRVPTHKAAAIEIKRAAAGEAFFVGLQTCGSVWDCAMCAAKISERRAWELNTAANHWLREHGGTLLLATYTLQHRRADSLASVLLTLRKAYGDMKARRDFKSAKLSAAYIHDVTALEVTHGKNGWHPHLHSLIFCETPSKADQDALGRSVGGAWQTAVKGAGGASLPAVGFDLRSGDYAADYASKWGAVREIANAANKTARLGGRTPQQLLAAFALDGDMQAAALWQEYSEAFHGRRQLQWSHGAREAFGIDETDDDAAAAEIDDAAAETWASIDLLTWRCVIMAQRDIRISLLQACENDDRAAFDALLALAVRQDMARNLE